MAPARSHNMQLRVTAAWLHCRGARTKPLLVIDHASPSTRLLEKWRQMFEVQEALESQKQEFAAKVGSSRCRCSCQAAV